jgi:hypothetical protein
VALAAASLLPVALFAGLAFTLLFESERAAIERSAIQRTRALMTAVDSELTSLITVMQMLATSPYLDRGRPAGGSPPHQGSRIHRASHQAGRRRCPCGDCFIASLKPELAAAPPHINAGVAVGFRYRA